MQWLFPRPVKPRPVAVRDDADHEKEKPPVANAERPAKEAGQQAPAEKPVEKPAEKSGEKAPEKPEKLAAEAQPAAEPEAPEAWVTLGSADPADPYRMLVTLTSKGAAVARIELNSPKYCDIDDRSGYLGHLFMSSAAGADGCAVQVVGPGTPAAEAGLKPGDVIKSINGKPIADRQSLERVLAKTKPKQTVRLVVVREGKEQEFTAKLRRRPLDVVKPEGDNPLSMLLTLQQFGDDKLPEQFKIEEEKKDENGEKKEAEKTPEEKAAERDRLYAAFLDAELKGVEFAQQDLDAGGIGPNPREVPLPPAREGPGDHQDLTSGPGARRGIAKCRFPGLSPGVRDRDSQQCRRRGAQGGLSAGRAQRSAHRGQLVRHASDP